MKKIIPIIVIVLLIGIGIYIYFNNEPKKEIKIKKEKEEVNIIEDKEIKKSIFKDYYEESRKLVNNMTIEEKIAQLFLVRYDKNIPVNYSETPPGGYILFAKDFENHNKTTIKEELDNVQKISKYPLIIGVDEEGGYVTRVSKYTSFKNEAFASPRYYYEQGGYTLLEEKEKEKAELLKEIGINLNLAPVADVSTDPNDFIYNRTFGKDAKTTSELVKKMVEYANKNKINSCLKHFPGYGNNKDTHTGIAIDNRSYESIKENDYLPFKKGIEAKVPSILVSHNIVNSIDKDYPASLSTKVINELRKELKFTGIIMTDDLAMDAVKDYVENNEAATLAITSGNDMIITSDFPNMYNEVLNSYKEGKITDEEINNRVLRIIAWKYYSNLF